MRLFFVVFWLLGTTAAHAELDQWRHVDFESYLELNQHVFLYELARSEALFEEEVTQGPALSQAQKQILEVAVDAYRPFAVERRDLLRSDTELAGITNALMSREALPADCPTLCPVFQKAAPVYQAHFWPNHQQINKSWLSDLMPKLEAHGDAVLRRLEQLFHAFD